MRLYTERKENDYERIVDIYVDKANDEIPFLDDRDTCKLIIIRSGSITLQGEKILNIKAPAVLFLSNEDLVSVKKTTKFSSTIVYLKPTVINDVLTYDKLHNGEFEHEYGTTSYQDYLVVRNFFVKDDKMIKYLELTDESLAKITGLIEKMNKELSEQYDGYWPCRSRSYLIEILFFVNFCFANNPHAMENDMKFTAVVIEYLNQHIEDKIELKNLTNHFHVNRNFLNKAFLDEYGMTCLNYLLKLRIDLAKMWLSETEIPIAEIGRRLGYVDNNYFTKVFRKECGMSPIAYRQQ